MALQFHETFRGAEFYDHTMPSIARSLKVIAKTMEEEATKKELKYKKLLSSVIEKISENKTISEQIAILRSCGFSEADLKEFGYAETVFSSDNEN